MLRTKLLITVFILAYLATSAQDIHFSQYYASPLTLNPANTGNFNAKMRAAANYRNQWFTIPTFADAKPYVTYAASFDAGLLRGQSRYDQLGAGLQFFNDRSGDGGLSNLSILASVAYHRSLDRYKKHQISLGFQGGMVQRRLDFTKLVFENQFNNEFGFDPSLPNGENVAQSSFWYADFNGGVMFQSYINKKFSSYVGFSVFHLNRPKESFLTTSENRLAARYNFHGGLRIMIGDFVHLNPSILYMLQAEAQEILGGVALGFDLTDETTFYLGGWYRAAPDAAIITAAIDVKGLRVGLSYDATTSSLKNATNRPVGAVELSLIYLVGVEKRPELSPVKFCPRF